MGRRLIRLVLPLLALSGCFALFPLDDYGSGGGGAADGGVSDARPRDAPVADAKVDADLPLAPARMVFVLDTQRNGGELMSAASADTLCALAASDAGLQGTSYAAWLSDRDKSAAARWDASVFAVPEGGAPLPLVMPDRTPIAASFAELADSGPRNPIVVDARMVRLPVRDGGCVAGGIVWTDTDPSGATAAQNPFYDCFRWANAGFPSGNAGAFGAVRSSAWTNGCPMTACTTRGYLYCVEQ